MLGLVRSAIGWFEAPDLFDDRTWTLADTSDGPSRLAHPSSRSLSLEKTTNSGWRGVGDWLAPSHHSTRSPVLVQASNISTSRRQRP